MASEKPSTHWLLEWWPIIVFLGAAVMATGHYAQRSATIETTLPRIEENVERLYARMREADAAQDLRLRQDSERIVSLEARMTACERALEKEPPGARR